MSWNFQRPLPEAVLRRPNNDCEANSSCRSIGRDSSLLGNGDAGYLSPDLACVRTDSLPKTHAVGDIDRMRRLLDQLMRQIEADVGCGGAPALFVCLKGQINRALASR